MSKMLNKTIGIGALLVPLLLHFAVMTALLVLALFNIKYGLEAQLIGSERIGIIDDVYVIIYWLYWGSVISFAALFYVCLYISSWIKRKKERADEHSKAESNH